MLLAGPEPERASCYNQGILMGRAQTAAAELVSNGVSKGKIAINRDSSDERPPWPPRMRDRLQAGRSATVPRREDTWSLVDWSTIAVPAEI